MQSLLRTISTGYHHNDKPVITEDTNHDIHFKESIKETVDTGFGDSGTIHKKCPTPDYVQYLEKANYLSEFKSEFDKALARQNLGVYSSEKVDQLIQSITNNVGNIYITKTEVTNMVQQIKFVDSAVKAHANYDIPNNLFRL